MFLNIFVWGMVVDCVDYVEWKIGVCVDGVVILSMSFINKLGVVLVGLFLVIYLGIVGYVVNVDQIVMLLNVIKNMNVLILGFFILLFIIFIVFYFLMEKRYKYIIFELE